MPNKDHVRLGDWFQRKDGARWYRKVLVILPRLYDYDQCSYATVIPGAAKGAAISVSITAASGVHTCRDWGRPVTEDEVRLHCPDVDAAVEAASVEYRERSSEFERTILHAALKSAPTEILIQEIMRREAQDQ